MSAFPVSPLSLDCLTRDTYGAFDASIIAQLAPLAENDCYQPKFYRAPELSNEVIPSNGYASYGLKITPGSISVGNFLGGDPFSWPTEGSGPVITYNPWNFLWRMTDVSMNLHLWDDPIPAWFFANAKGDFPNLWPAPYPVTGDGLFNCEFWNQAVNSAGAFIPQIIQVILLVLEPCDPT